MNLNILGEPSDRATTSSVEHSMELICGADMWTQWMSIYEHYTLHSLVPTIMCGRTTTQQPLNTRQ